MSPCPLCGADIDRAMHRMGWDKRLHQTICGDCADKRREIREMGNRQGFYVFDAETLACDSLQSVKGPVPGGYSRQEIEALAADGELSGKIVMHGYLTGPIDVNVEKVTKVSIGPVRERKSKGE